MDSSTHTPENQPGARPSSTVLWLYVVGFVICSVLVFMLPAPYSLYLLIALVVGSILLGVFRLIRPLDSAPSISTTAPAKPAASAPVEVVAVPLPKSEVPETTEQSHFRLIPARLSAFRNGFPVLLALLGFALMVAAAFDLRTLNEQTLLLDGGLKAIAGGLVIGAAVRLSRRLPALGAPLDVPLGRLRRFWWVFAGVGVVMIAVVTEINGQLLHMPSLAEVPSQVQYVLLMGGILLVGYGFGGAPPLLPRLRDLQIRWSTVLPLSGILGVALFVRLWNLGTALPYLIDELHWSDAILAVESRPNLQILTPMSGQSPYTWVFPYWQTMAVHFLGHTFDGFRFVSAIAGVLTVLSVYFLARELFDRKTALLSALILATFPPHIMFSRVAMTLIADPLFGTMSLMFIARALRNNKPIEWSMAGVSLGMTQYFYEGGRLLFPPLVLGFIILLALRGKMRGKVRGFVIFLVTAVLVGAPIYYTLIGNDKPFFGRFDDSGLGSSYWHQLADDGVTFDDVLNQVQHTLTAFMMFGAHRDLSVYYGGQQALILDYLLPFFLFGCFYLVWRYPSPAFLIALWIVATGVGNGLLRDTLVSARYYVVVPALAVALAAGVRYLFAFVLPDPRPDSQGVVRRESRVRWAIPAVVVGVIAVLQVGYFFGPHLAYFNVQVRDEKPYRDGLDAANRAVDLPGNTQIFLIGMPTSDQTVTRNWLGFLSQDGDPMRYYPLLAVSPDTISPKYLNDLPTGVNYAFYVDPTLDGVMRLLYRTYPGISPAMYSRFNVPAHKEFVLFYVPSETLLKPMPLKLSASNAP
ncbi:MAG: glycosyltransferase family 39 protein [Anaerolineae bacterium]